MIRALVISNGIGAEEAFPQRDDVRFDVAHVTSNFTIDLSPYDVLIAPNGTDHVALYRVKDRIRAFLDAGGALLCFCGWFLDWVPGNRWIHDNSKSTREMRHFAGEDPLELLAGVDLTHLDHNRHGISGWWACGYIEPAEGAHVLIRDTWGRAVVVVDSATTAGFMFLTASGPLGQYGRYHDSSSPIARLYENLMRYLVVRSVSGRSLVAPVSNDAP